MCLGVRLFGSLAVSLSVYVCSRACVYVCWGISRASQSIHHYIRFINTVHLGAPLPMCAVARTTIHATAGTETGQCPLHAPKPILNCNNHWRFRPGAARWLTLLLDICWLSPGTADTDTTRYCSIARFVSSHL